MLVPRIHITPEKLPFSESLYPSPHPSLDDLSLHFDGQDSQTELPFHKLSVMICLGKLHHCHLLPCTLQVFTFQAISGASPCTTPPPHTPPEVPGFLLPPERVIITQPTPVVETVEEIEKQPQEQQQVNGNACNYEQPNFELELSGTQQELYSRQFSSSPESETTEKDQQYAELVSSPDVSNQEIRSKTSAGVMKD
ncbi:hypothetical protein SK128_014161 [Halocaridina rubra]|uniref:Uncharacterized protein n=1 Tax=Halocaridina rubra TaxID=373956 RepID=A0AAN8XKE8_HALRR